MIAQIHEILCTIIHLYSVVQTDGALPPAILYDIAKFTEYVPTFTRPAQNCNIYFCARTLQKIYGFMKMQQGLGKIKQLFKQFDTAAQLKECQEELQGSLERFRVSSLFPLPHMLKVLAVTNQ
jgi:hypothetical protein